MDDSVENLGFDLGHCPRGSDKAQSAESCPVELQWLQILSTWDRDGGGNELEDDQQRDQDDAEDRYDSAEEFVVESFHRR